MMKILKLLEEVYQNSDFELKIQPSFLCLSNNAFRKEDMVIIFNVPDIFHQKEYSSQEFEKVN